MKIGIIADPPTVTHSCAVVASQLAKQWVKQNHEVHYLGYNYLGEKFLYKDGYPIYKDIFPPTRKESVLRFIKETGVEILYAHGSKDVFAEGMKAARECGIPYVPHTFYASPYKSEKTSTFEGRTGFELFDCAFVDDICVCNNFSVGVGYALGKRTWFVPNGVDPEIFKKDGGNYRKELGIPDNAFVVLYSGSNISRKDPETALKAFALLFKSNNGKNLFLAMHTRPESDYVNLRAKAKEYGVEKNVKFFTDYFPEWLAFPQNYKLEISSPPYTNTPYELMAKVFRTGNVCIAPTLLEGLSTTMLEAQACGLPVICSDDPVVSEAIVNFSTGLLVHRLPTNECVLDELVNALTMLHNSPDWCKEMAKNAERLMHAKYNYKHISKQLIYIFNTILNKNYSNHHFNHTPRSNGVNEMWYHNRKEVENIGRAGACYYQEKLNGNLIIVGRQLDSFWLAAKKNDPGISEHIKHDGFWEPWITSWMSRHVSHGSLCIDVGANYGYYTLFLAQKGCKVISIEANPELIPFLKKSVELNGCTNKVQIINKAAAENSAGVIKLNLRDNSLNSTILNSPGITGFHEIEKVAIDELTDEKVDFIKIDVEGAEDLVWEGMERIMSNNNCVALMEFTPHLLKERGEILFEKILTQHAVSYIDKYGFEQSIGEYNFFEMKNELFWMLVIRGK